MSYSSHRRLDWFQNPRPWFSLVLLIGYLLVAPCPAAAQGGRLGGTGVLGGVEPSGQYPSQQYYIGLEVYRSGDLEQAIRVFDAAMRSTVK